MLPKTGSVQAVIRVSGTLGHFLIHVHGAVHIHTIKQMGLATKHKEEVDSIKALKLDWEITKDMYSKCKKDNKTKKDDDSIPTVTGPKAILNKA